MQKIAVQKIGSRAWTRYFIHDDQGRYWTGHGWSDDRRSALLYADWNDVSHDYKRLEESRWAGVPSADFRGFVTVRVWGCQEVLTGELRDWLHRAVAIVLNHESYGTGPAPGSMVRVEIDWSQLQQTEQKKQP